MSDYVEEFDYLISSGIALEVKAISKPSFPLIECGAGITRTRIQPFYYYDNKKTGEVDYLIDDMVNLSVLPLEIKSGKDYQVHSALDKFLQIKEYNIHQAFVLSNAKKVEVKDGVTYLPIYYIACIMPEGSV